MTPICPHCQHALDSATLGPGPSPPVDLEAPTLTAPAGREEGGTLLTGALPPMPQTPFGGALGDYELLNELGAGGMGIVYRARQRGAGRVVAVKVIRADILAGLPAANRQEWVQRFQAEAQATARLEHDHIVTVYEVRESAGHHFYSMRYVDGRSLAEIVRDGPLSNQRAAAYLEPVARAVHHAHTCGILHRDLKPHNILVDGNDRPYVTDFGLVKLLHGEPGTPAPDGPTRTGHVMGTPEFMSPEQANSTAQLTTASDVYSLGATLYALLTGRPPFRAASALDTLLQVIEQEPVPPRQLNPAIDRDLETITLKCLQKEPSRRYPSAADLADDLHRYRSGEPIHARPVGRVEKAWRWCRRKPLAAGLLAAVVILLVGGTTVSTMLALWAWQEKGRADENAEREGLARQEAEKNEKQATEREAAKAAVLGFVEDRIIAAARPVGLEGGLGHDVTLRQALEAALPFVETTFRDQPLLEARLRMTLGASFLYLGEYKAAQDQYQAARTIFTQQHGPEHPDTLRSIVFLATAYGHLGRGKEAYELFDQTLALQRLKLGENHPDALLTMSELAGAYFRLGRAEDAARLNRVTLARRTATLGAKHPDTLQSMNNLASNLGFLGQHAEALELSQRTLELRKATRGADHPETLESMSQVATIYLVLQKFQDAYEIHEKVLELKKRKFGPEHPETLQSMHNLANCLHGLKRHADGLKLREQALPLLKKRLGIDHSITLRFMHLVAGSLVINGRGEEALKLHLEAIELARTRSGANPTDPLSGTQVLAGMQAMARSHESLGQHAEALKIREEVMERFKELHDPNHADVLLSMYETGASLAVLRRHAEALKLFEEVLTRRRATIGPDHRDTRWSMIVVAERLIWLGRGAEAVALLDECVQRTSSNPAHADLLFMAMGLRCHHFKNRKDAAGLRASAELFENLNRSDAVSLYNAACYRALTAGLLRATDTSAEAIQQADADADRAMDWLRKAVAAGFLWVARIKADKDLDALREREDYQKLVTDLEEKAAKGK